MNDYIITYVYCPIVEYTIGEVAFYEQMWEPDWDEFHGTLEEVRARVEEMRESGIYENINYSRVFERRR